MIPNRGCHISSRCNLNNWRSTEILLAGVVVPGVVVGGVEGLVFEVVVVG